MTPVYLDYNATAPLLPEAAKAMISLANLPANPSSIHQFGRAARSQMDSARHQLADALAVSVHELIFTSGGTEANNLVVGNYRHILTSAIEHDAVLAACPDAHIIEVDEDGLIRLDQLEAALEALPDADRAKTLVSVMAANNETGVIQPIEAVAELCRAYNVACHSDMAQYLGKAPIDLNQMKLNFASFSAHKLGGPSGVGALYCRSGQQLVSLLRGGGQEQGRRAGTENIHGIIGFGAAVSAHDIANINIQASWRDAMEADIQKACPEIEVMGSDAPRLANTSALYLPYLSAQKAVMLLDLAGFAVSAGAACSSGKVKNSHVITAMARGDAAANVIRISSGWQSTKAEWTGVAKAIIEIYKTQH